MNSVVGPSFNENFAEKGICGFYEQYMRSTDRDANVLKKVFSAIQINTKF